MIIINYRERLENTDYKLTKIQTIKDKIKDVEDIDLIFDRADVTTLNEFRNFAKKFMDKYNIGKYVSKKFWGIKGFKDIQKVLLDSVKKLKQNDKKVTSFDLYDELKSKDVGKDTRQYTNYAYARVARTEGKRLSVLYQLESFRDAGLKYVIYTTRGDAKVRDEHRRLNGKEYSIDYLLSDEGESVRIPFSPNCLVSWKTPILTDKGYKPIKYVNIGDKVLTHTGKFKEVVETHRGKTDNYYKIELDCFDSTMLNVTGNHKIMTKRGWIEAKDLRIDDEIAMTAKRCLNCGKLFPKTHRERDYCSFKCFNTHTAYKQWEHQKNNEEIMNKIKNNMSKVSKEAHKNKKCFGKGSKHSKKSIEKFSKSLKLFWNSEKGRETIKECNKKRAEYYKKYPERHPNCNMGWQKPSSFENKLFKLCLEINENAKQGKYIKIFKNNIYQKLRFPDILIEDKKLILEYDGLRYHQDINKDKERDEELNLMGYKVLHYRGIIPSKEQLKNDIKEILQVKELNIYKGVKID